MKRSGRRVKRSFAQCLAFVLVLPMCVSTAIGQATPSEQEFLMPTVVEVASESNRSDLNFDSANQQEPSTTPVDSNLFEMPVVVEPAAVFGQGSISDPKVGQLSKSLGEEVKHDLAGFQDPAPLLPTEPLRPFSNPIPESRRILDARSLAIARRRQRAQARVPNMIGDTTDGACGAVHFFGNITSGIEHPTFNCIRLNIAESNSPIPRDRIYFRYNHFENITKIEVFPGSFENGTSDLNVDRFTFGGEKTFLDGLLSIEARVPFSRELTSNVLMQNIQGETNFPIDDIDTEFGNISFIGKMLLKETETASLSMGLGLNVPTADDVNFRIRVDADMFPVIFPGRDPIAFLDIDGDGRVIVDNDVFNLSPFFAGVWSPSDRLFLQGFLQVDMPLNEADVAVFGPLDIDGRSVYVDEKAKYVQQDLFRLNVGTGYWLLDRPDSEHLTGFALTAELHFTSTLEDAQLTNVDVPLPILPVGPPVLADLTLGNTANRVDILNLTMGGTFELWNQTTMAHGFVVPLRTTGASKPFDFEYTLQLNHRF